MQQNHLTELANLLESFVSEASTAIDLMRGVRGADALLKRIHGSRELPHDVTYKQVDKISWSDIKGRKYRNNSMNWILVKGERGMGAIRAQGVSYRAMAVDAEDQIVSKDSEKGGDVLDFLKTHIGKMKEFYIGSVNQTKMQQTLAARKERKPIPAEEYSGDANFSKLLMRKFRPIWVKAIEGAINDIKGWAQTMVKNHSFSKAGKKMEKLERLEHMVEQLKAGKDPMDGSSYSDPFDPMKKALHNAIQMTAHHYHPDKSGGFAVGGGVYHSSRKHDLRNSEATEQLFNDIRDGDTKKLSTLISFLRRELVTS